MRIITLLHIERDPLYESYSFRAELVDERNRRWEINGTTTSAEAAIDNVVDYMNDNNYTDAK